MSNLRGAPTEPSIATESSARGADIVEGRDHDPGSEVPDRLDHGATVRVGIGEVGIREPRVPPLADAHDLGGGQRLFGAKLRRSTGTGFPCSQVENAGRIALVDRADEGARAGKLDVIAVCSYGKKVDGHRRFS